MGRPPKLLKDKLSERVLVRLTINQKKLLMKAAKRLGTPAAEIVRVAGIEKELSILRSGKGERQ